MPNHMIGPDMVMRLLHVSDFAKPYTVCVRVKKISVIENKVKTEKIGRQRGGGNAICFQITTCKHLPQVPLCLTPFLWYWHVWGALLRAFHSLTWLEAHEEDWKICRLTQDPLLYCCAWSLLPSKHHEGFPDFPPVILITWGNWMPKQGSHGDAEMNWPV